MLVSTPYKLQIFLPEDIREALKQIARRKHVSLQQLVCAYLEDIVVHAPEGAGMTLDPMNKAVVGRP
jgi:hypothetical protein